MKRVLTESIKIREFGVCEYLPIYQKMQAFSQTRLADTFDEFWILEHKPVYTLGLNGKRKHILNPGTIPIIEVDRGGQVTYHGPGQLIVYLLMDVRRKSLGVRKIVTAMENAIIDVLAELKIQASAKPKAPGVYVKEKKIAALGLRIKNGKSYHGLSLNIELDLSPFDGINPCGHENLAIVQIKNLVQQYSVKSIKNNLIQQLMKQLQYSHVSSQ